MVFVTHIPISSIHFEVYQSRIPNAAKDLVSRDTASVFVNDLLENMMHKCVNCTENGFV